MKYVKVRIYKGKILIDIREYYTDTSGKFMPGKRGITLTHYEWEKLAQAERYITGTIFNYTYLGDTLD